MSSTTGLTAVTCSRRITVKLLKKNKKKLNTGLVYFAAIGHTPLMQITVLHMAPYAWTHTHQFSTNFKFMLGLRHSTLKQAKLFIECETIHSPLI